MEHSLHLAAKHFVQAVAPHCKKRGASATDSDGEDNGDNGDDEDGNEDDDDDDDDDEVIDAGDSLGKAIALVKQVCYLPSRLHKLKYAIQIRKSPQARAFFRASCAQVKIEPLELLLWIRTRWGSLFSFLERFIKLKSVRGHISYLSYLKLISPRHRLLSNSHSLRTPVKPCQTSRRGAAMPTSTCLQQIGGTLG